MKINDKCDKNAQKRKRNYLYGRINNIEFIIKNERAKDDKNKCGDNETV